MAGFVFSIHRLLFGGKYAIVMVNKSLFTAPMAHPFSRREGIAAPQLNHINNNLHYQQRRTHYG
jgi:hypothetical protein